MNGAVSNDPTHLPFRDPPVGIIGLRLEELAHEFEVPVDACRSWCALYAGGSTPVGDVREHTHLENNVLFPRFGAS